MFEIDIFSSIADIDQEVWRQLNYNRPFSSPRWYQFLESACANDQPIYIILYKSAVPVALAVYWVKADEPLPLAASPVRHLAVAALRRWPLLLCHDPLVGGQSCLLLPNDSTLRPAALETISRLALDQLRQHNCSFALYPYIEKAQSEWSGWPSEFIALDFGDPQTILPLKWASFEEYLTWMRQSRKSAYKDYRRHNNQAVNNGIEVTIHDRVTAVDEALTLVHATHERHGSMPHPNIRAAMEQMPLVEGRWLAARQNGRLVGSGLLLGDRGGWVMLFLGLDYGVRYAYFQLIYTALREAIDTGGEYLIGGASTYQLKERLGFQRQNNSYIGFMSRSRLLSWFGRRLTGQAV